jgi:hypothetical protein
LFFWPSPNPLTLALGRAGGFSCADFSPVNRLFPRCESTAHFGREKLALQASDWQTAKDAKTQLPI